MSFDSNMRYRVNLVIVSYFKRYLKILFIKIKGEFFKVLDFIEV